MPQVGVTPEGVEVPRCTMDPDCAATVSQQPPEHRATLPTGPDPKWRYFWRLGSRSEGTAHEELNNQPNVVPAGALSGVLCPQYPSACLTELLVP